MDVTVRTGLCSWEAGSIKKQTHSYLSSFLTTKLQNSLIINFIQFALLGLLQCQAVGRFGLSGRSAVPTAVLDSDTSSVSATTRLQGWADPVVKVHRYRKTSARSNLVPVSTLFLQSKQFSGFRLKKPTVPGPKRQNRLIPCQTRHSPGGVSPLAWYQPVLMFRSIV